MALCRYLFDTGGLLRCWFIISDGMVSGPNPAERVKAAVDDVADAAWDVAGGVLGLAIVAKGIEMVAGGRGESDSEAGDEEEE